jgi:hypothetical protein
VRLRQFLFLFSSIHYFYLSADCRGIVCTQHLNESIRTTLHASCVVCASICAAPTEAECAVLNFWFGRAKPPPPCDLFIPASHQHQHLLSLIPQVPTSAHASRFDARPVPNALRSIFGLAGPNPLFRAISSFQHHTNTSTPYPPSHRSPRAPTQAASMPDRYRTRCAQFSVWQGQTPNSVRSLHSSITPAPAPLTPHPTSPHKHPCKPLRCQTGTERTALNFQFGRAKPPLPCDLFIPASHQHQHPLPLIPQGPTSTHVSRFNARPIPSALRSIFGLAGPNPLLRAISSFQHPTSTSTHYPPSYRSP